MSNLLHAFLLGVATCVIGFISVVPDPRRAPTYECGNGMHNNVAKAWNQNGEQARILDVWDDKAKDPIPGTIKGKLVISCIAKARFSLGGDYYIRYSVTEERGSKWTRVRREAAL